MINSDRVSGTCNPRAARRAAAGFLLAAALLTALAPNASALETHVRKGWVAGIGFGFGVTKVTSGEAANRIESGWNEGTTPRMRLGHMLGKRMMIGYEQYQWVDEQGLGSAAVRVSLQSYAAALTFFPGRPDGVTGGIYLRAGVGLANARIAVTPDAVGGVDSTHSESHVDEGGTSYLIGGGYELRIAKPLAVGVDVTANHHSIGGEFFDKAWFIPVIASLNWYF